VVEFAPLLQRCVASTQCYDPEALVDIREQVLASVPVAERTEFELVNETTLQGAARLAASGKYRRVGVLNFASARNPGGGFLGGAKAQEESLARSSGLYSSLLRCPDYYAVHRREKTLLYSDRMIFSPDCPILRTDDGTWLETPFVVSFITSAAPNAGAIALNQTHSRSQIPAVFHERIGKVLALAAHHGCDALILGAWGCGAFRNDPQVVAPIFAEYLRPGGAYWGRFSAVLFSVLDTSKTQTIYSAFARALAGML
jgi:uncharacterized protein (TIGR02452 family)